MRTQNPRKKKIPQVWAKSRESSFQCDVCAAAFAFKYLLTRHMREHLVNWRGLPQKPIIAKSHGIVLKAEKKRQNFARPLATAKKDEANSSKKCEKRKIEATENKGKVFFRII